VPARHDKFVTVPEGILYPAKAMTIRDERPGDHAAVREVIRQAFASAEHTNGREWKIVEALREADALSLSLVADDGTEIVGHVAVTNVTIAGAAGWYALGPVSVHPRQHRKGIGSARFVMP
jgi:predicted N-acetyltransferase YhbS